MLQVSGPLPVAHTYIKWLYNRQLNFILQKTHRTEDSLPNHHRHKHLNLLQIICKITSNQIGLINKKLAPLTARSNDSSPGDSTVTTNPVSCMTTIPGEPCSSAAASFSPSSSFVTFSWESAFSRLSDDEFKPLLVPFDSFLSPSESSLSLYDVTFSIVGTSENTKHSVTLKIPQNTFLIWHSLSCCRRLTLHLCNVTLKLNFWQYPAIHTHYSWSNCIISN